MTRTIAEALIEEGLFKGRAEGALQICRENLRRLLMRKYQTLPDAVLQRIEACTDLERLQAAIDNILDMKSLEELAL